MLALPDAWAIASPSAFASSLGILLGALSTTSATEPTTTHHARHTIILRLEAPGPQEILIRGGEFVMGSTVDDVAAAREQCSFEPRGEDCSDRELFPSLFADELEAHTVSLGDFWLDRTEVTIGAYRRCVEVGVCRAPAGPHDALSAREASYPVTLVSWDDAATFCRWQSRRLPTEAEWERAARGWAGRRYAWGHVFNRSVLNHGRFAWDPHDDSDGFATVAPVGSFPAGATPEGIVDLLGNVEEWVADWYSPSYPADRVVDPRGPDHGDVKVIRGGSYQSGAPWLRSATRAFDLPSRQRAWRGFRCARDYGPRPHGPLLAP